LALSIFSIGRRPKLSDEEIVELKHRIAKELKATQDGRDIMIGMSDDMVKALEEERERRKLRSSAETATALLGEYFKKRSPRKEGHRQHESQ
jgi:hypothetical protein